MLLKHIQFVYVNTVYFTDLHQNNIPIETAGIVTPVSGNRLWNCLEGYHNRDYIASGFRNGFSIGMPSLSNVPGRNIQLRPKAARNRYVVIEKLNTELAAGRILGPYRCSPMPNAVFSPLYVIPKSTPGKFRLIHDLSKPTGCSVNDNIPDSLKSVQYCSVIQVAKFLQQKTTTD